jgi:capsular exopolysaccharide synthesis family protein
MEIIENKQEEEEGIDYREIIFIVLRNWYWFVLSAVLCVGATYFYLKTCSPVYQRTAVLLVKSDDKSNDARSAMLELSSGFSFSNRGVENDIYILSSNQLMRRVVEQLRLDLTYEVRRWLRSEQLYAESPVQIVFPLYNPSVFSMEIVLLDSMQFRLESLSYKLNINDDESKQYIGTEHSYGEMIETPVGEIVVNLIPDRFSEFAGKSVFISRTTLENATNRYQSGIKTSLADKQTTLVKIDCSDTNISRANDILNTLIEVYNETIIDDKNRIAQNTSRFIDLRIGLISKELSSVEEEMTEFKQRNRIVDIKSSANIFLNESSKAREDNIQLNTLLNVAKYIKTFISEMSGKNNLIPNVSGIGDTGIQTQINDYNELLLKRDRLLFNSGENNPTVLEMNKNLLAMLGTISGSVDNYINTLQLRLDKNQSVENQLMSSIQAVPLQEKMALTIIRQQEIKASLYTFLLNKREENELQLSITVANIRVVETPFGSTFPISPKRKIIFLAGFLISMLIPSAFFYLQFMLDSKIRGRKDVEKYTTIPIIGEVLQIKTEEKDEDIVIRENRNDRHTEAFRLLRANFGFMNRQAKILTFTSTIAGEGKSFVSRNFAVTLALSGKRVILIDADLRKATQSKIADLKSDKGLSTYLSGNYNYRDVIVNNVFHKLVDMIPSGIIPPNPTELLMSDKFEELIHYLRRQYDYVLIDSVPAGLIADAVIINRVADITFYVVRDGKIDRRYLPELEKLHREEKFKNMCIILNGCDLEKRYGYYGYYGYGSYGGSYGN